MSYGQGNNQQQRKNATQIARADGKGRILDLSDMLHAIPKQSKVKISITEYGNNGSTNVQHYINTATAKLLFHDILNFAFTGQLEEFKGTTRDGVCTSKVMRVKFDEARDIPYIINLSEGPGRQGQTGAVMPNGNPDKQVSFFGSVPVMRQLAIEALDYIRAWEADNFKENQLVRDQAEQERRDNKQNGNNGGGNGNYQRQGNNGDSNQGRPQGQGQPQGNRYQGQGGYNKPQQGNQQGRPQQTAEQAGQNMQNNWNEPSDKESYNPFSE